MTNPVRSVDGHVVWTVAGDTWGIWRVEPPTTPRLPMRERLSWHRRVTAMLMMLPDSMILSITRPVSPARVTERMVEGVDLMAHPAYAAEVRDRRDALARARLTERSLYLTAKLPSSSRQQWGQALAAASARVCRAFGVTPLPPSPAARKAAHQNASDVAKPIAALLGSGRLTPATEAEVFWLYARAGYRGTEFEPLVEDLAAGAGSLGGPSLVSLAGSVMTEGGDASDGERAAWPRYVRLDGERGSSYQTFFTLAVIPPEWVYPHGPGACLSRLGQLGYPLDWSMRIRPTANHEAQSNITTQVRKLAGQFGEYDGDLAGAPDSLLEAIGGMKGEAAILAGSPAIPELQVTVTICLAAATLPLLEQRMAHVRAILEANEFSVPRPFGDQGALWHAMQPCSPDTPVTGDYTQFLLPADAAGMEPFAGSELGDPRGPLFGLNLDADNSPVLFSVGYGPSVPAPRGPMSGSVAICGKVGSGKSHAAKDLIRMTIALGGQVLVTDRTTMGEYVRLGPLMPGRFETVEVGANSPVCLDPLQVFEGDDRIRYTTGFLTMLTATSPSSVGGAELEAAVRRVAARNGTIADVAAELANSEDDEGRLISRKLRVHSQSVGLAKVVFGSGKPLVLDADYIVFHVPHLTLPSREALTNPVLAAQLLPDQVFSQALLYLITAVKAEVAFRDRSRFSLVVVDEAYVLTRSPLGEEMLLRVAKDGRKHNAGLLIITHLPSEIPEALSDVMGARLLFRMQNSSAPEGLRWLGLEVTQPTIDSILEENRNPGECLFVDRFGRAGLVLCLPPADPELRAAYDTSLSSVHRPTATAATSRTRRPRAVVLA